MYKPRTTPKPAYDGLVTFHMTSRTLLSTSVLETLKLAVPEWKEWEDSGGKPDYARLNMFFTLGQVWGATNDITYGFTGDDAPVELLDLRDFWHQTRECEDMATVWQAFQALVSFEVADTWYQVFKRDDPRLKPPKALEVSDKEAATDPE